MSRSTETITLENNDVTSITSAIAKANCITSTIAAAQSTLGENHVSIRKANERIKEMKLNGCESPIESLALVHSQGRPRKGSVQRAP